MSVMTPRRPVGRQGRWVERHFPAKDGPWRRADLADEGRFPISCPEKTLSLADIYEGLG
jgi:hypothetical protein